MLTVDPAGLPVGIYSGKIRFESAEAGNSPLEVTVTLQVTGKTVYLPVVLRLR